jgi:hypothetical protein
MALGSAVRVPILHRIASYKPSQIAALPILWAAFLTLLIAGAWLAPGYFFGTDWPGPRRFDFPTALSSSAGLQFVLAAASRAIGGEATGKLFVFAILLSAPALAYRAVPAGGFLARATAATIYVVNPFVYGRLHYGQLFLLAGYAVLPWVASRLHRLLVEPNAGGAILAAISLALVGVLSIHVFFESFVLAGALVIVHLVGKKDRVAYVRRLVPALLLTNGTTLAASIYWIWPLLTGRGVEGKALAGIGASDLSSYATLSDPQLGLLPNALGLYGFWGEGLGRFTSMKTFVPLWPVALAALLLLSGVGVAVAVRNRNNHLGAWAVGLLLAAAIALVLEMGVANPATAGLVHWLDANFPPYRGMRDAGKWAALLALAYSQLGGLGADSVLSWVRGQLHGAPDRAWIGGLATGLLLALPLFYGNGLLYGSHGEIKPSQYPAGWYAADRILASDRYPDRTLFLPWHEYLGLSFIGNQNKVVASPAPQFFSTPILGSADPEVPGTVPPKAPDQVAVSSLVRAEGAGQWAQVLATLNVKYVLLARQVDWYRYTYLDNQADLVRVQDFGTIVLYRDSRVQ